MQPFQRLLRNRRREFLRLLLKAFTRRLEFLLHRRECMLVNYMTRRRRLNCFSRKWRRSPRAWLRQLQLSRKARRVQKWCQNWSHPQRTPLESITTWRILRPDLMPPCGTRTRRREIYSFERPWSLRSRESLVLRMRSWSTLLSLERLRVLGMAGIRSKLTLTFGMQSMIPGKWPRWKRCASISTFFRRWGRGGLIDSLVS